MKLYSLWTKESTVIPQAKFRSVDLQWISTQHFFQKCVIKDILPNYLNMEHHQEVHFIRNTNLRILKKKSFHFHCLRKKAVINLKRQKDFKFFLRMMKICFKNLYSFISSFQHPPHALHLQEFLFTWRYHLILKYKPIEYERCIYSSFCNVTEKPTKSV